MAHPPGTAAVYASGQQHLNTWTRSANHGNSLAFQPLLLAGDSFSQLTPALRHPPPRGTAHRRLSGYGDPSTRLSCRPSIREIPHQSRRKAPIHDLPLRNQSPPNLARAGCIRPYPRRASDVGRIAGDLLVVGSTPQLSCKAVFNIPTASSACPPRASPAGFGLATVVEHLI